LKWFITAIPHEDICFARSRNEQNFARELGAVWAGDTAEEPPEKLHAVIDTTPVWKPVVEALKNMEPGGRLVINAIRKEETDKDYLLRLDYGRHLWMEKERKRDRAKVEVMNWFLDVQETGTEALRVKLRKTIFYFRMEKQLPSLLLHRKFVARPD